MEVIFITIPAIGHLLSAVEVAKRIIHRDNRLSITVLIIKTYTISPKILSFIHSKSKENLTFLILPPLSNPPDPSSSNFFLTVVELYKPVVKQVVEDRVNDRSSKLVGFVLDMFLSPMISVGNDFKVPSYVFFASGANYLTLKFHAQSLADDHGIDITTEFNDPDSEFDIPGFRTRVSGKAIPPIFVDNGGDLGAQTLIIITRNLRKLKGILVNTFNDLEPFVLQVLSNLAEKGNIPPIYPVGPMLDLDERIQGESKLESQHKSIMEWLDRQPSSSVVFVCFGSMGTIDDDQSKEIAKGLENSGHRFLWSIRKLAIEGELEISSDEPYVDALPEGFLERTNKLGKVIGWAPQVSILAHKAVGGFVSHCGWNSTLESMWFGVPMATLPFFAEQNLNAFELVKEIRVAIEIRVEHQYDWRTRKAISLVSCEEIESGVKKLMSLDYETKDRVRKMSEKSREVLKEGGSSYEWLGCFIQDLFSYVG